LYTYACLFKADGLISFTVLRTSGLAVPLVRLLLFCFSPRAMLAY
jgi:hypothetical protein